VVVLAKCASVELFARSVSWLKVGGDDELGRRWRERARILGDSETAVAFVIVPASPMWMCKAWTHRLTHFAMCLEVFRHTSVYLSVLGGALAAIGKSSQKHAVKALQLARRQRVLAFYLGDDDLAARCHLYEAEAYVHLGKPALAIKIVAHERERHASNLVVLLFQKEFNNFYIPSDAVHLRFRREQASTILFPACQVGVIDASVASGSVFFFFSIQHFFGSAAQNIHYSPSAASSTENSCFLRFKKSDMPLPLPTTPTFPKRIENEKKRKKILFIYLKKKHADRNELTVDRLWRGKHALVLCSRDEL